MRGIKFVAVVAAVVLVVGSGAAYADQANGSYSFDCSGVAAVWDISGSYSGDLGDFDLGFSIIERSSGKLTGKGTFGVSGQSFEGTITSFGGSITGSSPHPHVAMNMQMSGKGIVDRTRVKISVSANLHYDLDGGDLNRGTGSGAVTVTILSTGQTDSRSGTFLRSAIPTFRLPVDTTGAWMLSLDLSPEGDKYKGTATIETSTGASADFKASGSYDSRADTSKIALNGAGGKLDLVISTSGAILNVGRATGKIFGQTINYKAP